VSVFSLIIIFFFRICLLIFISQYDEVSDELQKKIEQDFVAERKSNPKDVTGDTLHRSLVIARLYALSRGHTQLEEEDWNSAKSLERDRLSRIASS